MAKFKIAPDEWRTEKGHSTNTPNETTQAVIDGKTVLLLDPKANTGGMSNTLRNRGLRLRQHRRPEGLVVWAEPIEPSNGSH